MITGAIFDLDGTLLDSMPIWDKAAEMFLRRIGVNPEPDLSKVMAPMSMTGGARFLRDNYQLGMDTGEIIAGINHTIVDAYHHQLQLKVGVEEFLQAISRAGIRMTAATASDRQVVEAAQKRFNILNCFGRVFTCTEVGAGKEKPDVYLAAAQYMGTLPKDTWVFEDALHAIKTAKKAGFRTVGVYDAANIENWPEIKNTCDIYMKKLDTSKILGGKYENSINNCGQ